MYSPCTWWVNRGLPPVSRELLAITAILRDRRDQLVAEAEWRTPIATRFPDLSRSEAAEMFVSDSSLLTDGLGDSTRLMFEQLDEFVSGEEGSLGPTPDRTG